MSDLLKRWTWLPGLLCGIGLVVGCGGDGAGDMDDDGVNEVIEEDEPAPPGVPSTDLGETPTATDPPADVNPDIPGVAPTDAVPAPPNPDTPEDTITSPADTAVPSEETAIPPADTTAPPEEASGEAQP